MGRTRGDETKKRGSASERTIAFRVADRDGSNRPGLGRLFSVPPQTAFCTRLVHNREAKRDTKLGRLGNQQSINKVVRIKCL